ncbi:class I SAM-dependent methyltransferase [Streptomyces sp. NPDC012935]|uniref:class I SAM-dependent methyltransferase n=1 Tax=Streptomyces sp. NPDC012935 TaxID=3364857 RepID=UPI00367F2F37
MTQGLTDAAQSAQFDFGREYIRVHFGNNVALATQQMTHSVFRTNSQAHIDHLLSCLALTGRETLLDLGCGNGFILRDVVSRLRYGAKVTAVDISPDMLELAKRNVNVAWIPVEFREGKAEDLSMFRDGELDRVMANYIFHYIEDPDRVCGEIARVLSPEGHAIVSIEAKHSMPEMYNLHFEMMKRVGFPSDFIEKLPRGRRGLMTLDNAPEFLRRAFSSVEEKPYVDSLRFDKAEQFMDFYSNGHRLLGVRAHANESTPQSMIDELYKAVEEAVAKEISEVGYFEISKQVSVFVCRK